MYRSGAALGGSPLSGGYAGAKATQRFITANAQDEAKRDGLGIIFAAVLPRFSPQTGIGRTAIQAYAARSGQSVEPAVPPVLRSLDGRDGDPENRRCSRGATCKRRHNQGRARLHADR